MAWFDVEEECFSAATRTAACDLLQRIRDENMDFTGIYLCSDYALAAALLNSCNQPEGRNEIVAVHSPVLEQIKGVLACPPPVPFVPAGYDVVAIGGWSLVRDGLFVAPHLFEPWLPLLTPDGLLKEVEVDAFVRAYDSAASTGAVEPLDHTFVSVDAVQMFRRSTESA
jgi:hypothetical protein